MGSGYVSFPNLGIKLVVNSDAFTIFGITIKWYAVIIAVGFLLAFLYAMWKSKAFGLDNDRVFDVAFFGTLGGIVGARLYFVAFQWDYYARHLDEIFMTREGGLAIYGGIIGALLVGMVAAKIRKVKFAPLLDMAAIGFLIGQGIGRWGNFVNQEAYGSITSPDYLFGMNSASIASQVALEQGIPYNPDVLVHPCFLYESVWCLIGAVILFFYIKHRKFDGEIGLLYLVWYGAERAVVEGLRTDSLYIWNTNLRVSQLLSAVLAVVALVVLICLYCRIYQKRKTNPSYLLLYRDTDDSKRMLLAKKQPGRAKKQPDGQCRDAYADTTPADSGADAKQQVAAEDEQR